MEFQVKLYSDKPSKIGIKYPQEYSAVRAYEEIFHKNAGSDFLVRMEMVKDRLNLILVSEQTGIQIPYKGLEYKMDQLKKLQALAPSGSDLQFVHVFSKSNSLMIAKPFRDNKFIKVTRYELIGPGYFATNM